MLAPKAVLLLPEHCHVLLRGVEKNRRLPRFQPLLPAMPLSRRARPVRADRDWLALLTFRVLSCSGRTQIVEKRVKQARRPVAARKPPGKRKRAPAASNSIDSSDEV